MSFLNFFKKFDKKPPSILEDPISHLFVRIAVPSSVGTVFMTLYNVVDTFFAGKISAEALAALAQTFPLYFIIIALGVGLSIGTTSLIANTLGEKKTKKVTQNRILDRQNPGYFLPLIDSGTDCPVGFISHKNNEYYFK